MRAVQPSRRIAQIVGAMARRRGNRLRNSRLGPRLRPSISALTLNPTDHLELAILRTTVAGCAPTVPPRPLFMARVSRLRGTYTFTARMFVRVIAQYVSTDRDPRSVPRRRSGAATGLLPGSALFAYKLNWQSVLFVGYGDDRELSPPSNEPRAASTASSSSRCPTRSSVDRHPTTSVPTTLHRKPQ